MLATVGYVVVVFVGIMFLLQIVYEFTTLGWYGLGHCLRCNQVIPESAVICGKCGFDPTEREMAQWTARRKKEGVL